MEATLPALAGRSQPRNGFRLLCRHLVFGVGGRRSHLDVEAGEETENILPGIIEYVCEAGVKTVELTELRCAVQRHSSVEQGIRREAPFSPGSRQDCSLPD